MSSMKKSSGLVGAITLFLCFGAFVVVSSAEQVKAGNAHKRHAVTRATEPECTPTATPEATPTATPDATPVDPDNPPKPVDPNNPPKPPKPDVEP